MNYILTIISLIASLILKPVYALDLPKNDSVSNGESMYVVSGTPLGTFFSPSDIINSPVSEQSVDIRQSSGLKSELEPAYEAKEEIVVELYNPDINSIKTVLTNSKNESVETQINQTDKQGITTLTINPPQQFTPGEYSLEITDQTGTKIIQNFLWGVLAINPNKPIYYPNETANLSMAVLNHNGDVLCDAKLTLKITDPDGKTTELSTQNNQITINQKECNSSEFTIKPDYQAKYITSKPGSYLMELKGETINGIYTINDSFSVQSILDFDIERTSATRIYPLNVYPMTITIKANQDFNGDIYEQLPTSFELIKPEEELIKYAVEQNSNSNKKIKWPINIKKGESVNLHYQYKAPSISPQFYLTGPIELITPTDTVYSELRQWQIAADAVTETITTSRNWVAPENVFSVTVEAWGGGGAGGGLVANKVAGRGGGGAGGQYVKKTFSVSPGTTYPVVVGLGATGTTVSGTAGGDSTFNTNVVVAKGGAGGQNYDGGTRLAGVGSTAGGVGDTVYAGGSGSNGATGTTAGGAGGGGAGTTGAGGNASGNTAGTGKTLYGGNGGGGIAISANGNVGNNYGGGGGGGGNTVTTSSTDRKGGEGGDGLVLITYTANQAPNTPSNSTPSNGSSDVSLTPTLTSSAFSDPDGNTHGNSQWQVATDMGFTSIVWDSGTTNSLTSVQVGYTLSSNTNYYWRVRYQDNLGTWSSYSFTTYFTTVQPAQSPPSVPSLISPGSTTSFSSGVTYPTLGNNPSEITSADFNGDNKEDLAISNITSNNITLFINNGSGSYATGVTFSSAVGASTPSTIASADFNNDGDIDIITGNSNRRLTVFSNNGSGSFDVGTTYFGNYYPQDIATADFNGDNYIDIAVTGDWYESVTVLLNDGDGTFTINNSYSTSTRTSHVVTADFNHDGYPDLAATSGEANSVVSVFINNANSAGTFGVGTSFTTFGGYAYPVIAADIDNDNNIDLAAVNSTGTNYLTVFRGNGNGTFSVGSTFSTSPISYPTDAAFIDHDGDNYPDIAVNNYYDNNITIFNNNRNGTFSIGSSYPTYGTNAESMTVTDTTDDGNPDLAIESNGNIITIFKNTASLNQSVTPNFRTVSTDSNSDNLQYRINFCTNSSMSVGCSTLTAANIGWSGADVGTSSYSTGTTAAYVLQIGNSLAEGQIIYWKSQSIDPAGSNILSGTQTTPLKFTVGSRPKIPELVFPKIGSTNVSITPSLKTVALDPNNDNLKYKIMLCTNAAMSIGCTNYDQTISNIGWSGQDIGTSAYDLNTIATFAIPTNLDFNTMYYWRSYAIDYSGTNRWSSTQSTPNSFTTRASVPITDQTSYRWSADDGGEVRSIGDTWFDSTYDYRKPITITNNVGTTLIDHQIRLSVNTSELISAGKMNNDCSDLRVVDTDKSTPLNYWIESGCNTANTFVWVKIPNLAASTTKDVYLYYGNSSADTTSNGDNTFAFFDDFVGTTLNPTKWNDWNPQSYSDLVISNGILSIGLTKTTGYQDRKYRGIISTSTFDFTRDGYYIESSSKWSFPDPEASCGELGKGIFLTDSSNPGTLSKTSSTGCSAITGTNTSNLYYFNYIRFGGLFSLDLNVFAFNRFAGATAYAAIAESSNPGSGTSGNAMSIPNHYVYEKYRWFYSTGEKQGFDKSDNLGVGWTANWWTQSSQTQLALPSSQYLGFSAYNGSNSVDGWVNLDWIRLRKYVSSEPTFTIGTESTEPPAASGTTWLSAENVGVSNVSPNSNIRLRFSIKNTGDIETFNFRLQTAPKGASVNCTNVASGNFVDVGTTIGNNIAVMSTSPEFTNQQSTTQQLSVNATTYKSGNMVEHSSNQTNDITLDNDEYTEAEYNFQITNNAASNTSYCFRVVDTTTPLNSYTQVAELTTAFIASNQTPNQPNLPYVNNNSAQTGQQTPVYGLIDHSPAFSAIFDDPDTSNTSSNYQIQVNSTSTFDGTSLWDSGKTSMNSCNENSRCGDITYAGSELVDGNTYYWRIKFWDNSDVGSSWSETQQFSMNSSPTVSNVVINNNNSIDLSENLGIGISWVSVITDADSYTNISSVTGKLYRSGVGSSCALDNNNCYSDASCELYNCSDNSCSALCSSNIYFFAEPTDVSSNFVDEYWQAWVQATDIRTEVGSTISSSTSIDVNTMTGFSIGSTLVYGEVFAGSDTGSSNTVTTITNTSNSLINLEVTGDYMCTDYPACGGQNIEPTNQQFKLSSFTYGTGTTLTASPQVINIGISKPTSYPSNSSKNIYWGIGIPSTKEPGNYQGAITVLVY